MTNENAPRSPDAADAAHGSSHSPAELFPQLYDELRRLAASRLRDERANCTLEPTELVHEAWARLAGAVEMRVTDRRHFFALAANAMQRVLIDRARARNALKRQDARRVELLSDLTADSPHPIDALFLAELFERLRLLSERQASIMAAHAYSGMTLEEISAELGLSHDVVRREWRLARARLQSWLKPGGGVPRG